MCGRFTQAYIWAEIKALLSLRGAPRNLRPRYDGAPRRWGLAPARWRRPLSDLPATFNARAEPVAEKPMFRSAFKSRRRVITASGFYEWTEERAAKAPHYLSAADGRLLAFAGLWESWRNPETQERVNSAAIIVGPANRWTQSFHDRTPVILDWGAVEDWTTGDKPLDLLRPPSDDALRQGVVSSRMNRAGAGDGDPSLTGALETA